MNCIVHDYILISESTWSSCQTALETQTQTSFHSILFAIAQILSSWARRGDVTERRAWVEWRPHGNVLQASLLYVA